MCGFRRHSDGISIRGGRGLGVPPPGSRRGRSGRPRCALPFGGGPARSAAGRRRAARCRGAAVGRVRARGAGGVSAAVWWRVWRRLGAVVRSRVSPAALARLRWRRRAACPGVGPVARAALVRWAASPPPRAAVLSGRCGGALVGAPALVAPGRAGGAARPPPAAVGSLRRGRRAVALVRCWRPVRLPRPGPGPPRVASPARWPPRSGGRAVAVGPRLPGPAWCAGRRRRRPRSPRRPAACALGAPGAAGGGGRGNLASVHVYNHEDDIERLTTILGAADR